jgi:hypothetical protein
MFCVFVLILYLHTNSAWEYMFYSVPKRHWAFCLHAAGTTIVMDDHFWLLWNAAFTSDCTATTTMHEPWDLQRAPPVPCHRTWDFREQQLGAEWEPELPLIKMMRESDHRPVPLIKMTTKRSVPSMCACAFFHTYSFSNLMLFSIF